MVFRSNNNATCLVCFTNDSDKYVTIKKDTTVGTASEIIEVINSVDSQVRINGSRLIRIKTNSCSDI